jgi:hypothetical protein
VSDGAAVSNRISLLRMLRRVDGFRGERKLNMGYEKGDTVDAYCYGLLVGDDFFNKQ